MFVDTLPKRPPYFRYEVFNCELLPLPNNPPVPGNDPVLDPNNPPVFDPNNGAGTVLFYVAPVGWPNSGVLELLFGFEVFLSVGFPNILPTLFTILKQINDLLLYKQTNTVNFIKSR